MEIIPAIHIKNGRCVGFSEGTFKFQDVYTENPIAMARHWVDQGAAHLHLVDLDGMRVGQPVHLDIIGAIVRTAAVPVQVGGGVRSEQDAEHLVQLGVARVIVGAPVIERPEVLAQLIARFDDAIAVSVDARDTLAATPYWQSSAHQQAARLVERLGGMGIRHIVYANVERQGTLFEPNFAAAHDLIRTHGPRVIVSGGIASIHHLERLLAIGCEAVIIARALYTGAMRLPEALHTIQQFQARMVEHQSSALVRVRET